MHIGWVRFFNHLCSQPRSQGLSSLPPLVVGTETLVAAGYNLGGRKICWKGGATGFSSRPNVLEYPPTLRFWMARSSRDQPQPGSLFQRLIKGGREERHWERGCAFISRMDLFCGFSSYKPSRSLANLNITPRTNHVFTLLQFLLTIP